MITKFSNKATSWKTTTAAIIDGVASIGFYGTLVSDVVQIANHAESISAHPAIIIFSGLVKIGAKIALGLSARDNNVTSHDLKID